MILTRLPKRLALRLRSEIAVRDQMAIDELRAGIERDRAAAHLRPNLERVTTIVDDLMTITPLEQTAKAMDIDDDSAATNLVLDVVAAFGTWIGHSVGTTGTETTTASSLGQLPLMQLGRAMLDKKSQKPTVIIPEGYEPGASHGRDVTRALSLIVVTQPSREMISRFVSRTYQPRSSELTYPIIAGVWDFAYRGRLHRIGRVSNDIVFHTLAVEAYDLLEVARRDAVDALVKLTDTNTDPSELHRLCVLSRWLAPNEVSRIERAAAQPDGPINIRREQQLLAQRIGDEPLRLSPASIAELSLGQVLGISQAAGIKTEENRAVELAVRSELKSMGLSTDADRLLPEALRAASRGRLEDFWDVMRARVAGDITWTAQLAELFDNED